MTDILANIVSGVLILAGAGFFLTGAIGFIRMPDLFTRLHAASLSDTTGMALILSGLAVHAGFTVAAVKLVFLILFLLFMGPATTHALAAAALAAGVKPLGAMRHAAKKGPGKAADTVKTVATSEAKAAPKKVPKNTPKNTSKKGRRR
ncbi:monovalent cation/H(+) antiporter subunit G [Mesorhizobium sp. BR1-1-16]|uniref:monovalent cation/H(+) antiporter subunit G n=1 Tax=Mesorhizobium sp. BR1-1-16 TaxID=2876653 RepID=UPI001CCE5FD8|nr:monovalent cation/H(+) antiporter subunit G [Mesorhizobium sp. BR1-1-16]MBZ9934956.1 monovalent cation/H(+) antiporter subunit G [Mesorhizobium sp. BR1-1-16]